MGSTHSGRFPHLAQGHAGQLLPVPRARSIQPWRQLLLKGGVGVMHDHSGLERSRFHGNEAHSDVCPYLPYGCRTALPTELSRPVAFAMDPAVLSPHAPEAECRLDRRWPTTRLRGGL